MTSAVLPRINYILKNNQGASVCWQDGLYSLYSGKPMPREVLYGVRDEWALSILC